LAYAVLLYGVRWDALDLAHALHAIGRGGAVIQVGRNISLSARETFTLSMKAKYSNISVETGGGHCSLRRRHLIHDGGGVSRTPPSAEGRMVRRDEGAAFIVQPQESALRPTSQVRSP
jgi:hypothetical protein